VECGGGVGACVFRGLNIGRMNRGGGRQEGQGGDVWGRRYGEEGRWGNGKYGVEP